MYDGIRGGGSYWYSMFFVACVALGQFVVLNLFLAILLSNIDTIVRLPAQITVILVIGTRRGDTQTILNPSRTVAYFNDLRRGQSMSPCGAIRLPLTTWKRFQLSANNQDKRDNKSGKAPHRGFIHGSWTRYVVATSLRPTDVEKGR